MIFVRRADSDSWEIFTIGGALRSYGPFNTNKTPLALGLLTLPERWSSPNLQPAHRTAPTSLWDEAHLCATSLSSLLRDKVFPVCNNNTIIKQWSLKLWLLSKYFANFLSNSNIYPPSFSSVDSVRPKFRDYLLLKFICIQNISICSICRV